MKFGMLAAVTVSIAGFFVLEAPAQEVIQSSGTVIVPSSTQMVQPARTGLFGRLRSRNTMSTSSMTTMAPPMMAQTGTTTAPAIVQAGGTTTTPSTIVQAGGTKTMPATTMTTPSGTTSVAMTSQMAEPRQGLFGRLRSRLGR